jgi:hypothetical protein
VLPRLLYRPDKSFTGAQHNQRPLGGTTALDTKILLGQKDEQFKSFSEKSAAMPKYTLQYAALYGETAKADCRQNQPFG